MTTQTNDQKIEFLNRVIRRGHVEAVPELRFNGHPWPDFNQLQAESVKGITLYTKDPKITDQLRSKGIATDGEPVVEEMADGGILCQLKLANNLLEPFKELGLQFNDDNPLSDGRLYRLPVAQNVRVALAQCQDDKTGLSDILIFRSRDADNVQALTNILIKAGLIAKNSPRHGYHFQLAEDGQGVVAAVVIPTELANAIRNTSENNVHELVDYISHSGQKQKLESGDYSSRDVVGLAAKHLPAIEIEIAETTKKNKTGPVDYKKQAANKKQVTKKTLADFSDALCEHVVAFQEERRLDGTKNYYIRIRERDDMLVNNITSDEHCDSPVRLTYSNNQIDTVRYSISGKDINRIKELIPNDKHCYDDELPAFISKNQLTKKYDHTAKRYMHINELIISKGKKDRAYLTVVADNPKLLPLFVNGLDAKNDLLHPHYVTTDNERPAIVRLDIPEAAAHDIATQAFHKSITNKINIHNELDKPAIAASKFDQVFKRRFDVKEVEQAKASDKKRAEKKKKSKTPYADTIDYTEQQENEGAFLEVLANALLTQEGRDDYACAVFANVKKSKTKTWYDSKNKEKFSHQFDWVEPTLYVRLSDAVYQAARVEPSWTKADAIKETKQEGSGPYSHHRLALTLSAEGMERACEMFGTVPMLGESGDTMNNSLLNDYVEDQEAAGEAEAIRYKEDRLIAASVASKKVSSHFSNVRKRAEEQKEMVDLGLNSDKERDAYKAYMRWKSNPEQFERPNDNIVRNIEEKLQIYKERKARERAYAEIASKDLVIVDVRHLSDKEMNEIENQMAQIKALEETIQHHGALITSLGEKVNSLAENTGVRDIHPHIATPIEAIESMTKQASDLQDNIGTHIGDISGYLADYRTWLKALKEDRQAKQILVLRATAQTEELIDAINDQAHMPQGPIMLEGVMSNGGDVMMVFPTSQMMDELTRVVREKEKAQLSIADHQLAPDLLKEKIDHLAAKKLQRLSDEPVKPQDIVRRFQEKFSPVQQPETPKKNAQKDTFAIINQLGQTLASSKPLLCSERQENPYPNPAEEAIGEQKLLVFTVKQKRDLRAIQTVVDTLQENDLLLPPKQYGDLIDATHKLNEKEQQIKSLNASQPQLKELYDHYNNIRHYADQMLDGPQEHQPQVQQTILEATEEKKLADKNAQCDRLMQELESVGVLAALTEPPAPISEDRNLIAADWLHYKETCKAYCESLRKAGRQITDKLQEFPQDMIDALQDQNKQQCVAVKQSEGALLDANGQPIDQLEEYHRMQGLSRDPYMVKLYVKPEAWDKVAELSDRQRGRYTANQNGDRDRSMVPGEILAAWKESAAARHR